MGSTRRDGPGLFSGPNDVCNCGNQSGERAVSRLIVTNVSVTGQTHDNAKEHTGFEDPVCDYLRIVMRLRRENKNSERFFTLLVVRK